jgi:hypothetical protein
MSAKFETPITAHSRHAASVLLADNPSVKRLAWAFGCAKKDSDEEVALYRRLRAHFEQLFAAERAERTP